MATDTKGTDRDVVPISRDAVLAQLPQLLMAVPEAEDDDGSGIIAAVLMAADPLDAGGASELPEAEDMLGKLLKVEKISRRESTLENSESQWYLVVEGTEGPHRRPFIFGTSSRTIMAQLCAKYALGQLPFLCEVFKPSKPTRSGYYPLSLRKPAGQ